MFGGGHGLADTSESVFSGMHVLVFMLLVSFLHMDTLAI